MSAADVRPAPLRLENAPRRVLVVVTRRIGDVLLATPVVRSLKAAWPAAAIDVLVFAGTEGFLIGSADIERVLTVRERPSAREHLKLAMTLARRYDLALSLVPGDRPTLYAWLAGRRRVGLLEHDAKSRWKRALLDAWVPFDNEGTHTVRMHLALLDAIGVAPRAEIVPSWTPADEARVEALLAPVAGMRYAVLHPFPKFRYKMWTEEGWNTLTRWLHAEGVRVVLTGGPGAAEREYVSRIAAKSGAALDLSGSLTLGAVAYLVSRAALYVGPDTAITHAAAALGVPTVAIYGPTNPVKWGPWPRGQSSEANPWSRVGSQSAGSVKLVQGVAPCVPCGNEGCERHIASASDCLVKLSPLMVVAAAREALLAQHADRQNTVARDAR